MKKLAIVGAVLLVVGGLGISPARAVAGSPQDAPMLSAAEFLATLAVSEVTSAPELEAEHPGPVMKSQCTAMAQCASTTISCSGNSSCSNKDRNCSIGVMQQGYVTCDGVTTLCPQGSCCSVAFTTCENSCPNQCVKSFRCSPYSCLCGPPCI